ncbi:MAG: hypothetical protein FJY97_11160 [candidate division Zixibacteria bacterium]|nr:hypothetical protein [candidate division Zixibacteria bacterium]
MLRDAGFLTDKKTTGVCSVLRAAAWGCAATSGVALVHAMGDLSRRHAPP